MNFNFLLLKVVEIRLFSPRRMSLIARRSILAFILSFIMINVVAQSPGGVSANLALWVKANAGIITSGSNVTGWNDQSGTNKNLVSPSLTYSPVFTNAAAVFNFNPSLLFTRDFFRYTGALVPANSGGSVFTVASHLGATGYNTLWDFYSNDPTINTQGGKWLLWHGGASYHTIPVTEGKPTLITGHWQHNLAISSLLELNGKAEPINKAINTNGNNYFLGAGDGVAGEDWQGNIAENIVYQTPLTGNDLIKVNSYLAIKYGITLDANLTSSSVNYDYKASDGTIIWNGNTHQVYHNDITGIGRDDASALIQLKSKSINKGAIVTIENPTAFSNDLSYLVAGDDAGAPSLSIAYTPNNILPVPTLSYFRYGRIWKVQETGTVGTVDINISSPSVTHMLVHTSANFSTGTPIEVPVIGGKASYNFNDGDYFTFAGPATAPGGVLTNLSAWLKADAGASSTTHGAPVDEWLDQSGNNRTHTQSNAAYRPTYVGGEGSFLMNYQPALRFDGSNDRLEIPAYITTAGATGDAVNVFVVSRINATSTTAWQTVYGVNNSLVNALWYNRTPGNYLAGNQLADAQANKFYGITSHIMPKATGTVKVIWNGKVNTFSNYSYTATGTNYTVGTDVDGADPVNGDIQEVIVYKGAYNADFNVTNINKIQSYLAIKYGISLDPVGQPNYVSSSNVTYWTGANNTGYQQNIFGLGRDDNSSLNQKQAFSYTDSAISLYLGSIASLNNGNNAQIASDGSFLVLGDNNLNGYNQSVNFASGQSFQNGSSSSLINAVSNRIWKAQVTNEPSGGWLVNINPNKFNYANYVLVSSSNAFAPANTRIYPVVAGTANEVLINDGEYITMASFIKAPGGIATNLSLWVKADAGIVGSSNVSTWIDQTINEKDLSQPTLIYQPTFTSGNTLNNFNPSVTFSNGSMYRTQNVVPAGTGTSSSIFSVARATSIAGGYRTIWDVYSNLPSIHALGSKWNFYYGGDYTSAASIVLGKPTLVTGHWSHNSAASTYLDIDGKPEFANRAITTSLLGNYYVGSANVLNTEAWLGDINENIVYSTTLSGTDLQKVNTYLGIKYGITLADGAGIYNYMATDGSVIWNGTSATTGFHKNVTGIGRDDMEALNQKQSKSVNAGHQVIMGLSSVEADNLSNAAMFDNDLSYLVWGDNGAATPATTLISDYAVNVSVNHLQRIWRIENKGVTQKVKIVFPSDLLPGTLVGACEAYKFITSTASSISGASISSINTLFSDGTNYGLEYTFPAGTTYFTLARVDPSQSGVVHLPQVDIEADNFSLCSTTDWKYFYEDAAGSKKLFSIDGLTNVQLNNLDVAITVSGASYASIPTETNVMPRITTVTDVSAGTYAGVKVRIYYDANEQASIHLAGAPTNSWIKYAGNAADAIADIQDNGRFQTGMAIALIPDVTGVEDGVNYVEFHNISSFSSFLYISSTEDLNTVLPIVLEDFKATKLGQAVKLDWSTSFEQNSRGFEIERSSDGVSWKKLGFIPTASKGVSNGMLSYSFMDPSPLNGTNQYRLKQIDLDGSYIYSSSVSVWLDDEKRISLSPNPILNGTTTVKGLKEGDQIKVLTASGALILDKKASGSYYELNLSVYPAGIYHLIITNGLNKESIKILKMD